ncbi:DUF2125 domain-containing protein [Acetobacter conturbans]|uniref:DUF2125 domain-containing protein n=1 Tax=Acetobacter conturbans TaxID=1737472 RepID=A0ABX0JWL4_9PROT|nr:DUF2125 domain-containing protein [Acetobacter conturbans]NHN87163.1 DUF2125 domain-containing protein [Acetobacter conturbans]
MRWKAALIGIASLLLSGGGVALGIHSENLALLTALQTEQTALARQGWTLTWSRATPHAALLASRMTLSDLRLSGPLGATRLSYGCNVVTLSISHFSSRTTATFGSTHALLLARGPVPDLALRLTGNGITLAVHPTSGETEAALTIPAAHVEIDTLPSVNIPTPFTLDVHSLTTVARWQAARTTIQPLLTTDTTIDRLGLPQSIPGLGNTLDTIRIALSTSGFPETQRQTATPVTTLHLGEAHLGPAALALTGKLTWQNDPVGEFDLTLRGMDRAVRKMAASGSISPEIGQIAILLGRIGDVARTGGHTALPPTENGGSNINDLSTPETTISLPLRLREGAWSLGAMPLAPLTQWSGSITSRKIP